MSKIIKTTSWRLNSTLTMHLTNCKDYLMDYEEFEIPKQINGTKVHGIGYSRMISQFNDKEHIIIMDKVHYAPKYTQNIFSLLAAHDSNPKSLFKSTKTECWLKINRTKVLHSIRESDEDIFYVNLTPMLTPTVFPKAKPISFFKQQAPKYWRICYSSLNHISSSQEYMIDYTKFETPHEICNIGDHKFAIGMGNIPALSVVDGKPRVIKLMNVWHVPLWKGNLLSVLSALNQNPRRVYESTLTDCFILLNERALIWGIRIAENYYEAEINPISLEEYNEKLRNGKRCKVQTLYNNVIKKGLSQLFT